MVTLNICINPSFAI